MSFELKIYENTSVEEIDIMIEALQKARALKLTFKEEPQQKPIKQPIFKDPKIPSMQKR